MPNYSEFEAICKSSDFSHTQLLIIPGNHDANLSNKHIAAKNIRVFDQPTCEKLADGWNICYIPYRDGQTMGKAVSEITNRDTDSRWALVGHGDWFGNLGTPNLYEDYKVYMPLTRKEVNYLKPDFVFLGHIHVPQNIGNVFYAGSPCPVAVDETGYRRFLSFDTDNNKIEGVRVNTDILYFTARLLVMPTKGEQDHISRQIDQCKHDWGISEKDLSRVKIRVRAIGYSNDRRGLLKMIQKGFNEFNLLEEPDISRVSNADDTEKNFIIERFREELEKVDFPVGKEGQPDEEQILLKAMELVYGRL